VSRLSHTTLALLGLPAAFALGCIPSARIVSRLLSGTDIVDVGDRKPGAANVTRTLGLGPGVATAGVDVAKGFAVATTARALGAGPHLVGALAVTPVVAHIAVVRGRGAAAGLGAAFAIDAPATGIVLVPILGGTALKKAALGVILGAFALPLASLALGRRRRAMWCAALPTLVAYARLRSSDNHDVPLTPGVAWSRLWFDRDPEAAPQPPRPDSPTRR
jgi:glycerol-3-phosphate acyltransferase PlsY